MVNPTENRRITTGQIKDLATIIHAASFVCDFEFPLRKAVDTSWISNNVQCIQGEEFHFKQALIKQINQKGLQHFYQNKKDNKKYDIMYRRLMQLIFNLIYIEPECVKLLIPKIIRKLWRHVKTKYHNRVDIQTKFLHWIKYFLQYWCYYTVKDVVTLLVLTGIWEIYCTNEQPINRTFHIVDWNLCGKQITNSCSIEVPFL